MNIQLALIAFAIVFLVLWLKLRKRKPSDVYRVENVHNSFKLFAVIEKGTPSCCLLMDRRFYGESFQHKTPPELPCCSKCKCKLEKHSFKSSVIFTQKKNDEIFATDLGNLCFVEYKYYLYSLIIYNQDLDEKETQDYSEIRSELKVSDDFKKRLPTILSKES